MEPVTEIQELTPHSIDLAVAAVRDGGVVVLPTDTVYGVGANPFSAAAVSNLLAAKRRGHDMPPPVLLAEPSMMRALTAEVPQEAKLLAEAFWPGPLTLILDVQGSAGLRLGDTRGTVALRVPDHDGARALLRATGPLAVSSANLTGEPPATDCETALDQLGDAVSVYLSAGPTPGNVPSTIVDFSGGRTGVVLRVGALSLEELRAVVPGVEVHGVTVDVEPESADDGVDVEPPASLAGVVEGHSADNA
ncbi:threonylcarbamoyl-AMP synthase [Tessaracoccus sp. OH4464_COT-324]|nr:threonylcarbamoyl-AMP synthase [Tessaracoccus sp. OH4464_COT-324]